MKVIERVLGAWLVFCVGMLMLTWLLLVVGCMYDPADPLGKCGVNGTVDADPNPSAPPPHCG